MPEPIVGVCTLVLAAGHGRRYREHADEDKLLAASSAAPDAPPVLAATLGALRGVTERLVVVTRDDNALLLAWLARHAEGYGAEVFAVRTRGLGHSLAQAVRQYPAARGWLVALGDMPYVQAETCRQVAGELGPASLVVPTWRGQAGHPRGIGCAHAAQLWALDGERGAQALFAGDRVQSLEVDDSGVLQDIDRPSDRRDR